MRFTTLIMLLVPVSVTATELTIVNSTGDDIRIVQLRNKCDGFLVREEAPEHLKNKAWVTFHVTPVVQTYMICGSGRCSSSALGMKDGVSKYVMDVVLDDSGYITGNLTPDHWTGSNLNCPKHKEKKK